MMITIGKDPKTVRIIESIYNECTDGNDEHLTQWFAKKIVPGQACLLLPTLFNSFLEFVIQ